MYLMDSRRSLLLNDAFLNFRMEDNIAKYHNPVTDPCADKNVHDTKLSTN